MQQAAQPHLTLQLHQVINTHQPGSQKGVLRRGHEPRRACSATAWCVFMGIAYMHGMCMPCSAWRQVRSCPVPML